MTAGKAFCDEYRGIREQCLVAGLKSLGQSGTKPLQMAESQRALSGLYDQAARSAASL